MDAYKELYLDISKFDENKMTYIKPMMFYKVTRNMGIYYEKEIASKTPEEPSSITTKHKIIVKTPKMMIPFDIKEFDNNNKKAFKMCLSFSSLTNLYNDVDIKKFFQFVRKIDTINEETVMERLGQWKLPKDIYYKKSLKRISNEFPHHMNVNLPHDGKKGFLFNVYDESAKKADIGIITKRSIVSAAIELTDLRFNDNDFRANWNLLQIRKFNPYSPIQEFFMSGCFICDEDNPEDTAYLQIIESYKKKIAAVNALTMAPQIPIIPSPPPVTIPAAPPPPPPPSSNGPIIPRLLVSPDELLAAKNRLRSTASNNGEVSESSKGSKKRRAKKN